MKINLPRNYAVEMIDGHIFYPEDFDKQIEKRFREYTWETSLDYTDCDRLGFVECCVRRISEEQISDSDQMVNDRVKSLMIHRWDEEGEFLTDDDIYSLDFAIECYDMGFNNGRIDSNYGYNDHHIYDELHHLMARIMRIVSNCEVYDKNGYKIPIDAE